MSTLKVNKIQPNSSNHISIDGNTTITGSLVHNGHTTLSGTNILSGSTVFKGATTVEGDLTVGGTLTAQEVRTEFDNASVVFEDGSTKFGDTSDDNHGFTGSLGVQGGEFKVTNAGEDVLIANPLNGTFTIGDTQGLGDSAQIIGNSSTIKIKNDRKITLTTDSNNRVGIGTESPSGSFHVAVNSFDGSKEFVRFTNGNATLFNINDEGAFSIGDVNNIGDGAYLRNHGDEFSFMFGATQALTIGSSKSVFNEALEIRNISGGDATLTLEADTKNTEITGENDNPSILFKQDGGAKNAAVGFNIIDDTSNGTIAGTGNRFWIVNAMDDNVGESGITFGTAQVDGWDNAIARFMIRGDGKGLFGHPNDHYDKVLGSQFEVYDDRTENTTTDYTLAAYGYVDVSEYPPSQGAGGIISRVKIVDGATDLGTHAIGMVAGTTSSEILTTGDLAFFAGSNMDTSNATGFAGVIHSGSNNWQIGGTAATDTDTGYKLNVVGTSKFNSDVLIGGNLSQAGSTTFSTTACGIVWSMNTDGASIRFYNSEDGDTDSRLEFNTRDNNNEYFKWTHTTAGGTYESMRLDPINSGSNSKLTVNGDIFADSLTIGNSTNENYMNNFSSSIAGGAENIQQGAFSIIGAGKDNKNYGSFSSIVSGQGNYNYSPWSSILGGLINCTNGSYAGVVGGGAGNCVFAYYGAIVGGSCNSISDYSACSSIVGGCGNSITGKHCNSFIGGGCFNTITGTLGSSYNTLTGGYRNKIDGGSSCLGQFIGGGALNVTSAPYASVLGGSYNSSSCDHSTVVGGNNNRSLGSYSVIAGGANNLTVGSCSTISGGSSNTSCYQLSSVNGGRSNTVKAICSNIAGGAFNCINGVSSTSILGGFENVISGSGNYGNIGGGACNKIYGSTCAASILGGQGNRITQGCNDSILGGCFNVIQNEQFDSRNTIVNGSYNRITGSRYSGIVAGTNSCVKCSDYSIIGGGISNTTTNSQGSVIGGGASNSVSTANCSFIGGGSNNIAINPGHFSVITGGKFNEAACFSFVGGGCNNCITGQASAIVGGCNNTINTYYSGILGGQNNTVAHTCSFVIGNGLTTTADNYTFVNNLCNVGGGVSDSRLKENVVNIPYGLSQVSQLDPVSFTFKDDESKQTKYGFIAQCVQEVMPELVSTHPTQTVDGDPVLQFDKDAVWASTVNAIKELKLEVEALKAEISILKQK